MAVGTLQIVKSFAKNCIYNYVEITALERDVFISGGATSFIEYYVIRGNVIYSVQINAPR